MSKGNQVVPVRIAEELLTKVREVMEEMNLARREEPYTLSSWIRTAIEEKLAKRERGRHR